MVGINLLVQFALFLLGLIGFKTLRKTIIIFLAVSLVAMILAFYYYVISMLVEVYNIISNLASLNLNSNSLLSYFYDVANALGIIQGFEAGLPFIFSSLVFVLSHILYRHTVEILKALFFVTKTVLEG